MTTFDQALDFAMCAHRGQKDLAGMPYILHPMAVASRFSNEFTQVVALLHDVVEDTTITLETIELAFGSDVAECVDVLTKPKGGDWEQYIHRIAMFRRIEPLRVKLADIAHNSDPTRVGFSNVTLRERLRLAKYAWANERLTRMLESRHS